MGAYATPTGEIARNVQQARPDTQEVAAIIAGVKRVKNAAHETGRVSNESLHPATDLGVRANGLRTQVDSFIARARAA
jgi:hypothetical protein